jgi:hypothetical protein
MIARATFHVESVMKFRSLMATQQVGPISETFVPWCLCEKQNTAWLAHLTVQRPVPVPIVYEGLSFDEGFRTN